MYVSRIFLFSDFYIKYLCQNIDHIKYVDVIDFIIFIIILGKYLKYNRYLDICKYILSHVILIYVFNFFIIT